MLCLSQDCEGTLRGGERGQDRAGSCTGGREITVLHDSQPLKKVPGLAPGGCGLGDKHELHSLVGAL